MQRPARRAVWLRSLVLPLAVAALTVAAVASRATIMPGGGPLPDGDSLRTDCFVYAEAAGTLPVTNAKYLVCPDGDPTCDQDGSCNGRCLFRARVCLGLPEADEEVCAPPPSLERLRLNSRCPLEAPAELTGSACGAFVDFEVALRGRAQRRAGRVRCVSHAAAPPSVSRRTDSDVFVFTCVPPRGGCPASPSGAFVEPGVVGALRE